MTRDLFNFKDPQFLYAVEHGPRFDMMVISPTLICMAKKIFNSEGEYKMVLLVPFAVHTQISISVHFGFCMAVIWLGKNHINIKKKHINITESTSSQHLLF